MENPVALFQGILQHLSKQPYQIREQHCDAIRFMLEDYVKIFPPVSINTYTTLFSELYKISGFYAQDKTIVELGPGFSLGLVFLAALSGAHKTWAADLYPHDMGPDHDFIISMFGHLAKDSRFLITKDQPWDKNRLDNEFAQLIEKNAQGKYAFRKEKIEYLFPFSGEKLPFENETIDLSLSCAAFEHFRDPVAVVRELARITRPQGLSCHIIDLRDHRNFEQPLDFLTLSEDAWQRMHQGSYSYTYTNRLRHAQIVSLFDNYGFKLDGVRATITLPLEEEVKARFVAPYNAMPDHELETLVQIYVFKKDHACSFCP
jgi:SAM-dependent methyltransferase